MSFPGLAVRCLCAPAAVRLILLALLATPALGDFEPPPLPHTPEWQTWYDGLLAARLAACPRERATTYHFSQAGDDTAGNGSAQAPYRTLARARQVLAAHPGGDVALLFRRGDVWRETTGLIATAPNVTIAEYGDAALPKPLLSAFAPIPNPSAWAPLGALPNVYWRPMPGSISWVRETQDPDHPYWRVSSLLEVSAREGSWWWDQGTANLYIHPFHDGGAQATDPRTDGKPYEFVVPTWAGVVVSGNGSRIENLRAHGWGMWQVTPSQNHGIELRVVGEAQAVAVGCESYYGSSHAMTHLAGGMPGGVATFVNCKAGLCTYNAAGETVFNTYAHYGAQEVIFDHCEATHGTLPSSNFPAATVRRALGFYGHSIGPGYPVGLVVSHACSIRNRPYGCGGPSNFADLRAASSLADVRCFVMRELFEGGPGTGGNTLPLALTNAARVGGRYLALTPPPASNALAAFQTSGWAINCAVELELSGYFGWFAVVNAAPGLLSRPRYWNCAFSANPGPDCVFKIDFDVPSQTPDGELVNCVLSRTGPGFGEIGLGDELGDVLSCAYFGYPAEAYALDPRPLVLGAPHAAASLAWCGLELVRGALPRAGERAVRTDGLLNPGLRRDLGPYESWWCGDADADGTHSTADLYAWHQLPVDTTGDGTVGAPDAGLVERSARWGEVQHMPAGMR